MKQETITVYRFNELSDAARMRAKDLFRTMNDWEYILEDVAEQCRQFSFHVENIMHDGDMYRIWGDYSPEYDKEQDLERHEGIIDNAREALEFIQKTENKSYISFEEGKHNVRCDLPHALVDYTPLIDLYHHIERWVNAEINVELEKQCSDEIIGEMDRWYMHNGILHITEGASDGQQLH